eukprot:6178488-Pleurochrysis_carterae.AAC.5
MEAEAAYRASGDVLGVDRPLHCGSDNSGVLAERTVLVRRLVSLRREDVVVRKGAVDVFAEAEVARAAQVRRAALLRAERWFARACVQARARACLYVFSCMGACVRVVKENAKGER